MVAVPGIPLSSQAPDPNYNVSNFIYQQENDCYICPEGKMLTTTGTWHQGKNFRFKQYKTKACKHCNKRHLCTRSSKNGKLVSRSEYAPYLEKNKQKISCNKALYRKRQAIIEHPYGTIKRQWGFNYILTKQGIERAESDVGLMFIAYNLKRIINIVGKDQIMKYLKDVRSLVLAYFWRIWMILSKNKGMKILEKQFIIFLIRYRAAFN
jgi:hypothetical protein